MSLFQRLKEARLIRVLLVYLGASWVVIEAADLLQDALSLPEWVVPVIILLLLAGLVVVGATAWIQASPQTDRREAAGEVPGDWQIDLPDLGRSIRRGRLPHLTWGRAVAGGVVAILAVFGLAALLVPAGGSPELGPRTLEASEAAPGLAVLPFRATAGSETELGTWREGVVDLLSRNLDGLGGLRAIDSRTVLARWRETAGSAGGVDLATALEAAARTGARWALVGTAVDVGGRVRITADVHDVATGARLDGVRTEGPADSVLSLVDALSVDVARILLEEENPDLTALQISSITTESPAAMSAFLEGEAAYRRMRFEPALQAYQRALEIDPGFALAHYRVGSARAWTQLPGQEEARQAAYDHRDRLPAREALMIEAEYRARRGALPSGVALLREGVRRYPDDPELWYQLGDVYLHSGSQLGVTPEDAWDALERAVALDPGFAPYQIHLVEMAMVRGDSAEAAGLLERERSLAGDDNPHVQAQQLRFDYTFGSDADRARVERVVEDLPALQLARLRNTWTLNGDRVGTALRLTRLVCREVMEDGDLYPATAYVCLKAFMDSGRIEEAASLAARLRALGTATAGPASLAQLVLRQTGLDPDAPVAMDLLPPSLALPDSGGEALEEALLVDGFAAIAREDLDVADSIAAGLAREAGARRARGDTLRARIVDGFARGVAGHGAAAAGRWEDAIRLLRESERLLAGGEGPDEAFRTVVVWPLAELLSQQGRDREALRYYATLWGSYYEAPALARRAELHERLGESARADTLRRQFLRMWSDADPGHPLLERVRRGLPDG